jgi:hypothetical protein
MRKATGPLRAIVKSEPRWVTPNVCWRYETLECGHEQRQKEDIYGPTNAYKRRCRRCADERT